MRDIAVGRRPIDAVLRVAAALYVGAVVLWLLIGAVPSLVSELSTARHWVADLADGNGTLADAAKRAQESALRAKHPARVTADYVFASVNLGLGLLVLYRQPRDRVARLLAIGMIGTAVTFNVPSHALLDVVTLGLVHQFHDGLHVISGIAYTYAVVLFPDGRLVPHVKSRTGLLLRRSAYVAGAVILGVVTYDRISVGHPGQAYFVRLFGLVIPIAGFAAQSYRLRRATSAVSHQQSRALRWGLMPLLACGIAFSLFPPDEELSLVVFPFVIVLVPVSIIVGIFRYRLWDIDLIVNRALLVGILGTGVVAIDALFVVGVGRVLGLDSGNAALWVIATTVALLAVEPARRRAASLANQVVYGTHTTPEEGLAELVVGLDASASGAAVVERAAAVLGEATGATVTIDVGRAQSPTGPGVTTIPIGGDGSPIGALVIKQPAGVTLTKAERALAEEVAAQVSLVLRNDRLASERRRRLAELERRTRELEALRRRLITTEDAARRRLERDIHDGAQQHLVALSIELELVADSLADGDPDAAEQMRRVNTIMGDALDVLGDLARGVYPEALRQGGPAPALAAIPVGAPVAFEVHDNGLGRHDPDIEAGVYFSCLEAVQNACKHAAPSRIHIVLGDGEGCARFTVEDDGAGFDAKVAIDAGGLRMLRDRVDALGGEVHVRSAAGVGTVVSGSIPSMRQLR